MASQASLSPSGGVTLPQRLLWASYARVYDGLLDFYPYRTLVATVVDRLGLADGVRVLDIGCGTGNVMLEALGRAAILVHGVDAAPAMVERASRKLAACIRRRTAAVTCGDAVTTMRSMPDGCFDRICMMNVLYAVPDRESLWRECLRLLAPGGHIVATTSTRSGSMPLIREHVRHASQRQLASARLLAVCLIDGFICLFAKVGRFAFPSEDRLYAEVVAAGGVPSDARRTYGGEVDGVNVLFTVRHPSAAPHLDASVAKAEGIPKPDARETESRQPHRPAGRDECADFKFLDHVGAESRLAVWASRCMTLPFPDPAVAIATSAGVPRHVQ